MNIKGHTSIITRTGLVEDGISEHGIGHHDAVHQETHRIHQCVSLSTLLFEIFEPFIFG